MSDEEVQKDDGAETAPLMSGSIPLSPYSNIKRQITETDLESPAVQRILLSEVDKLQDKTSELEEVLRSKSSSYDTLKDDFHESDKDKGILEEKLKRNKSQEILYSFCLTSGSIIIGLAKTVWTHDLGEIFLGIGLFLIIGGIITKAVTWN